MDEAIKQLPKMTRKLIVSGTELAEKWKSIIDLVATKNDRDIFGKSKGTLWLHDVFMQQPECASTIMVVYLTIRESKSPECNEYFREGDWSILETSTEVKK